MVLLAVYVALGRQFFPLISEYRQDLEVLLQAQLNKTVEIKQLSGGWSGLNPVVELKGVTLGGSVSGPIQVDHLKIELSFWASLRALTPKIKEFSFDGVHVQGEQNPDGSWQFGVLTPSGDTQANSPPVTEILQRYLVLPFVQISHSEVRLTGRKGNTLSWQIPDARLFFEGNLFTLTGKVFSADNEGASANLQAQGGYQSEGDRLHAHLYLDWEGSGFLNDVLDTYSWQGLSVQNLSTSGKLWLTIADSTLHEVRAVVDVDELRLQVAEKAGATDPELTSIDDLHFDAHWSKGGSQAVISVSDLAFTWQGMKWPTSNAMVQLKPDSTIIAVDQLSLGILAPLITEVNLLGEAANVNLKGFAPEGMMKNIWLTLPVKEEDSAGFTLGANLDGVSVQGFDSKPSVANLYGYLNMSADKGEVVLDAPEFELGFPELFSQSWHTSHAQGRITWELDSASIVHLRSYGLVLDFGVTPEGLPSVVTGDFYSLLPEGDSNNWLGLSISPHNIPAIRTAEFVPQYRVPPALYEWLSNAIQGGLVREGTYIGQGLVGDEDASDAFASAMHFSIEAGRIQYAPAWPALEALNGDVTVTPRRLDVFSPQLTMGGIAYQNVVAEQELGGTKESPLKVRFSSLLDGKALDQVLREYPFKDQTLPIAQAISVQGRIPLKGRLDVPLSTPERTAVDLSARLQDATLSVKGADLKFKGIKGDLRFSSWGGLSSPGLAATFFDRPVKLGVVTQRTAEMKDTEISLTGALTVEDVLSWSGLPGGEVVGLSGKTDFSAALRVQQPLSGKGGATKTWLDISSNLVGVGMNLPNPFQKASTEEWAFRYSKGIGESAEPDSIRLGTLMSGVISQGAEPFPSVTLAFNQREFDHSTVSGLHLRGQLDQVDVEKWSEFAHRFKPGFPSRSTEPAISKEKRKASIPLDLNLRVGQLIHGDVVFKDTQVILNNAVTDKSSESQEWQLDLKGKEISGKVRIPESVLSLSEGGADVKGREAVVVRFDHIYLPGASAEKEESATEGTSVAALDEPRLSIQDLPDMDVAIQQLNIGGENWGSWTFTSHLGVDEMVIEPLEWRVGKSVFRGRLNWKQDPLTGHQSSVVIGELKIRELLGTLQQIGYETPPLDAQTGLMNMTLVWPRSPEKFGFEGLSGNLDLTLQKGQILGATRSADALKLFSIFNLDTLSRRLRLDFTDLFSGGISFDEMTAEGYLQLGELTLKTPLVMRGPSNAFKLTGRTHLVKETLDMNMVVVFPLTENLPVAVAMVGAPAVGGALWAIDKLLEQIGDPLSRLTSANYRLSGTWSEPSVELKSVFDSSPDSKPASASSSAVLSPAPAPSSRLPSENTQSLTP